MMLLDTFAQFRIFAEDATTSAGEFKTRISLLNGSDEIATETFHGTDCRDMADSLCRRRGWFTMSYLKRSGCLVTRENGRDYECIAWYSDSPLYFRRISEGCRYFQQFLTPPDSWMKKPF